MILTAADRAKDAKQRPIYLRGFAQALRPKVVAKCPYASKECTTFLRVFIRTNGNASAVPKGCKNLQDLSEPNAQCSNQSAVQH
jgi:hypothetical protein